MTEWLVLTATLPTSPSALRVRVWRALKATGAGTLREGVHVLPTTASTAEALWNIARIITESGAEAHMLVVPARDDAQEKAFRALFDRSDLYGELVQSIRETRGALKKATEVDLHKRLRTLEQQLAAIQAGDFFPGKSGESAARALAALRREVELHLSPDEPSPTQAPMARLARADFQNRTWATRKRPWVDRLATAWLVMRFVDESPTFTWLADPKRCPKSALGYDFDGATFTHVGNKVTFEVIATRFGLDADAGIEGLAKLVHCIDVGGIPLDEAPGFEMLVRGLQALHADDDALLSAAIPLFDALHAGMKALR
ncbi:MAG: chromate resistance protein [Pseudomonadota bacterium]|nr:chromate resistance protein [Pseudomonadota bacterium]